MIAGDHRDPHPGRQAGADRIGHISAQRVKETHQPHQRQALIGIFVGYFGVFDCQRQQPQPLARGGALPGCPFLPRWAIQRRRTIRQQVSVAGFDHRFGRAFDGVDEPAPVPVRGAVDAGHHLMLGVKGVFGHLGKIPLKLRAGHRGCLGGVQQCDLHWLTVGAVSGGRIAGFGIVAQHPDPQRQIEAVVSRCGGIFRGPDLGAFEQVAHRRHFVLCQCAGLISEDQRRCPQSFYRGQPGDQRIVRRHAPHAARQTEGGDDRQAFGHRRHRQRRAGADHVDQRVTAQNARCNHQRGQSQRQPDQPVAEPVQPPLQWRYLGLGGFCQGTDLANFGCHPGGHDDGLSGAAGDRGPLEHHVVTVWDPGLRGDRVDTLGNGQGFPGQDRFIALQVRGLKQTEIGGDDVSGIEDHDISRNQRAGIDPAHSAVAAHQRPDFGNAQQCLHRADRAQFGEKPDGAVEQDHHQDRQTFWNVTESKGQPGCHGQQPDDDAAELMRQKQQRALRLLGPQLVSAVAGAAGGNFGGVQAAGRIAGQRRSDIRCRQGERQGVWCCARHRCHITLRHAVRDNLETAHPEMSGGGRVTPELRGRALHPPPQRRPNPAFPCWR